MWRLILNIEANGEGCGPSCAYLTISAGCWWPETAGLGTHISDLAGHALWVRVHGLDDNRAILTPSQPAIAM